MQQIDKKYTLSEYERLALANRINLSDGHARLALTDEQRLIISKSLEILDLALSRKQEEIETEFLGYFFHCAAQKTDSEKANRFLTFSSSSAIKMAAQYCRLRKLNVLLIEPCFDNIVLLLKTEGVNITPIQEDQLYDVDLLMRLIHSNTAIWIVQPNNPTGFCLSEEGFRNLVGVVAKRQSIIIVDFCFRFYAESLKQWDQYHFLREANVPFICFEDTGKTWSLADTKVGITVCSTDVAPLIYRLHDELLLNVSPFHLLLLTEFIKNTITMGFQKTIRYSIERNRELVHRLVERGIVLHASHSCENVPIELLGLPQGISSMVFWDKLRRYGIDILPAQNYFWSRPEHGKSLFRIPLSRPLHDLEIAVPIIEQSLIDLVVS